MNCEETKKYLDDYILGEIDPSIEIQVNDHLATCKECRKELKESEMLLYFFKKSRKSRPDRAVFQRILSTKPATAGQRLHVERRSPAALLSVIASFFLGIVVMYSVNMFVVERKPEGKAIEVRSAPARKVPLSDTVKFYYAPSKNLAQT